ncbi:MAG: hypothetical protein ACJ8FT_07350 [Sphingomonas sp.]
MTSNPSTGPPGVLAGELKVKIVVASQPEMVPQAAVIRLSGRPNGFWSNVPLLCSVVMKLLTSFLKNASEIRAPGWK